MHVLIFWLLRERKQLLLVKHKVGVFLKKIHILTKQKGSQASEKMEGGQNHSRVCVSLT